MATIQCSQCKAHLSVRGLVKCPLCRANLYPPASATAPVAVSAKRGFGRAEWIGLGAVAGVALVIAILIAVRASPSASNKREAQVRAGLTACQLAIVSLAKFSGSDTPPEAKNFSRDGDDEFYFGWPRGSFTFADGKGGREPMSASCTGTLSTGKIFQLTLNAKDMI